VRVRAAEKLELIHLVEGSSLSVRRTLVEIGLARSTFYAWYKRYLEGGRSIGRVALPFAQPALGPLAAYARGLSVSSIRFARSGGCPVAISSAISSPAAGLMLMPSPPKRVARYPFCHPGSLPITGL
jgi:transposase-like protein